MRVHWIAPCFSTKNEVLARRKLEIENDQERAGRIEFRQSERTRGLCFLIASDPN